MTEQFPPGPLISVVVPVHNAQAYLEACLESLFGQTLAPIEIIAVDDASTDGSRRILATAAAEHGLRLITFDDNRGVSAARNAGLAAATGEFVAFVDADDLISPTMYEELYRASQLLSAEVVSCGMTLIDAEGRPLHDVPYPWPPDIRLDPSAVREKLHTAFTDHVLWYPFRSLYRRSLLAGAEIRFDESIRKGEDSVFNLAALAAADGWACVGRSHYSYRKHDGSATARPLDSEASNLQSLGEAVARVQASNDLDARAWADFTGQLLRSDLPTVLVRLRRHPDLPGQIRALLGLEAVRQGFAEHSVLRLGVPARVVVLLLLCRFGLVRPLAWLLRRY